MEFSCVWRINESSLRTHASSFIPLRPTAGGGLSLDQLKSSHGFSPPLPLAGEVDALDRARRVGENCVPSDIHFRCGTPTPTLPRKRERERTSVVARHSLLISSALADSRRRASVRSTEVVRRRFTFRAGA